jgi:hypothetical protein
VRHFNVALILGVLFMAFPVSAAEKRVCGNDMVLVKAALGQAVEIIVENGVGDLVRSGDPATLKVEHTSGHLFLTPLGLTPADVTLIDMRGQSHLIRFVFEQPVDEKIVMGDCDRAEESRKEENLVMAFMRSLIRGRAFAGTTEKKTDVLMFDDGRVRMRAVLIQELPQLWGYVMVVENLIREPVIIPVQTISFPGLLAVSSAKDRLAVGEQGNIYMVVGR